MVKEMAYGIVVSEFVLLSHYYVHFRANTIGKGMNPLSSHLWVNSTHRLFFSENGFALNNYKGWYAIKQRYHTYLKKWPCTTSYTWWKVLLNAYADKSIRLGNEYHRGSVLCIKKCLFKSRKKEEKILYKSLPSERNVHSGDILIMKLLIIFTLQRLKLFSNIFLWNMCYVPCKIKEFL